MQSRFWMYKRTPLKYHKSGHALVAKRLELMPCKHNIPSLVLANKSKMLKKKNYKKRNHHHIINDLVCGIWQLVLLDSESPLM